MEHNRLLSPEEYLTHERLASFKSEYHQGIVRAMQPPSYHHCRIATNMSIAIRNGLIGTDCYTLTSDMRIHVSAAMFYTYPDVIVVCGKPALQDEEQDVLLNPRVIIEVLSESTSNYDRGGKFKLYQKLASLEEYILVEQDEARVECFAKQSDHQWLLSTFTGLDQQMQITCLNVKIPLSAIYEGVQLPGLNESNA